MGLAWCKVSSLTAAVSRLLEPAKFPLSRSEVLALASGRSLEGWEVDYFLEKSLRRRTYHDRREVMADLEEWLEAQA
jgi:hypothetical protein